MFLFEASRTSIYFFISQTKFYSIKKLPELIQTVQKCIRIMKLNWSFPSRSLYSGISVLRDGGGSEARTLQRHQLK